MILIIKIITDTNNLKETKNKFHKNTEINIMMESKNIKRIFYIL